MNLRTFAWLLRQSVVAAADDNCFGIAKGAAYSALLSFFPVLTSAATLLVQTRAQYVSNLLEGFLAEIVPPGSESLVVEQFRITGARPAANGVFIQPRFAGTPLSSNCFGQSVAALAKQTRMPTHFGRWRGSILGIVGTS